MANHGYHIKWCSWLLWLGSAVLFASMCLAESTEIYPFNSRAKEAQFQHMLREIRCLVCQNQNLADSNAPLAQDLRQIIYERTKSGESDQVIKRYLVSRYTEYILFKPSFSPRTYLLWLGPFILLFVIIIKFCNKTYKQ